MMRALTASLCVTLTACTGSASNHEPTRPAAGGHPLDPSAKQGSARRGPATGSPTEAIPTHTYYVAPDGKDTAECSEAMPCRSLQRAANIAREAGSLVLVADGEYAGFESKHSGITFRAAGRAAVVSSGYETGDGRANDNINIEGNDDIVLDGFVVRNAGRAGIRVVESSGVIVRNNRVGPNGKWGIFTGFAMDVQILNNETFGSRGEHGIYVSNSRQPGDNPVVRGNRAHHNNHNGIQLNGDCESGGDGTIDGAIIENNVVYDNNYKGMSIIAAPGALIRNNLVHDNGKKGGAAGIHLVNEPGCKATQATSDAVVVNNTVVEPHIAAVRMNENATRNILFNNVLIGRKGAAEDEVGGNKISRDSNILRRTSSGLFDQNFRLASPAGATALGSFEGAEAPGVDMLGRKRPPDNIGLGAYAP